MTDLPTKLPGIVYDPEQRAYYDKSKDIYLFDFSDLQLETLGLRPYSQITTPLPEKIGDLPDINWEGYFSSWLGPKQLEWVEALESGKYKQGKRKLYLEREDSYCCLGVECKIHGRDIGTTMSIHPNPKAIGLNDDVGRGVSSKVENYYGSLVALNDIKGLPFKTLAQILRTYTYVYFKEVV